MRNTPPSSSRYSQISSRRSLEQSFAAASDRADRRDATNFPYSPIDSPDSEPSSFSGAVGTMKVLLISVLCVVATAADASTIVWTGTKDSRCSPGFCGTSGSHIHVIVHWAGLQTGDRYTLFNTEDSPIMSQLTELGTNGLLVQTRNGGIYAISLK